MDLKNLGLISDENNGELYVSSKPLFIAAFYLLCASALGQENPQIRVRQERLSSIDLTIRPITFTAPIINCEIPKVLKDLQEVMALDCNQLVGDELCNCLNQKANKGLPMHRILREHAIETPEHVLEGLRVLHTQNILTVYQDLNFGVGAQEDIFKMPKSEKVVGCDAKKVSEYFKNYTDDPYFEEREKGEAPAVVGTLDACLAGKNCAKEFGYINQEFKTSTKKMDSKFDIAIAATAACKNLSKSISNFSFSDDENSKQDELDVEKKLEQENQKKLEIMLKNLENMKVFYTKFPELDPDGKLVQIDKWLKSPPMPGDCSADSAYDEIENEYNFKSKFWKAAPDLTSPSANKIAEDLEAHNKKVTASIVKGYEYMKPDACISYKDFQVINSTPSENLLNSKNTDPDRFDVTKLDQETEELSFLRRNPILAKMAVTQSGREFISKSLQEISDKVNASPTKDKLSLDKARISAFSDFMREKVSQEWQKYKVNDAHICNELAKNLATVNSAKILPFPLPREGDDIGFMTRNFQLCYEKNNPSAPSAQVLNSLKENPFYMIMGGRANFTDQRPRTPERDPEYNDFIEKNCNDFEGYRKRSISMCNGRKACEEKFQRIAKNKNKKLLAGYFKNHNPYLGELISHVKSVTGNPGESIARRVDTKQQDVGTFKYYEQNVLPRIRTSVFPSGNPQLSESRVAESEKVIAASQEEFNKITNNGTIPYVPSVSVVESKTNTNQVVPSVVKNFEQPDPSPPAKVDENTFSQQNLNFENFVKPSRNVEDQIKEVEKKEDEIKKVAQDLRIKAKGDKDELEEIDEREKLLLGQSSAVKHALKNVFTPSKEVQRAPASVGVGPTPTAQVKTNVSGGTVGNYTGGFAQNNIINPISKKQNNDQMSQTLLDTKYAVNSNSSVALSNKYAELPNTPQGLVVKSQIQMPDSKAFDELLKDQKPEEFSEKLSKIIHAPYKAGVVAILDPNSKNEILVNVIPQDGGKKAIMELVSTKTKVQPQVQRSPASFIRLKMLQDIISQ